MLFYLVTSYSPFFRISQIKIFTNVWPQKGNLRISFNHTLLNFGLYSECTVLPHFCTLNDLNVQVLMYDWSEGGDTEVVVEDIERLNMDFFDKYDKQQQDWRMLKEVSWPASAVFAACCAVQHALFKFSLAPHFQSKTKQKTMFFLGVDCRWYFRKVETAFWFDLLNCFS